MVYVINFCHRVFVNKKTDVPQNPRYSRPNTPAVPDLDLGLGSCARSNVASDGKAIEGEVLALEGVDDIHRCDCLPTGIFVVSRIRPSRNVFKAARASSYTWPEMRLTPLRWAIRRIAGFVMPCRLSRSIIRCLAICGGRILA